MASVPSAVIDTDTQAGTDDLWMLKYLFCHNWAFPVRVSTSFRTTITQTLNCNEQRWGTIDRPYRTIKATLTIFGRGKVAKFRNLIARRGQARSLVPIYCDETFLTVQPSGPGSVFNVADTTMRRFNVGQRIAIVHKDGPDVTWFRVCTIDALTDTTITIDTEDGAVSGTLGDSVFPLVEAQLSLSESGEAITNFGVNFNLEATEILGNNTIEPSCEIGDVVADTFDGKQVLGIPVDWSKSISVGAERAGDYSDIGRGFSLQTFGDRARWTMQLPFTQMTREDSWDLLKFFEAHGGRLKSFYALSPFADMELVSLTDTTITVLNVCDEDIDWQYYTHIAIVETSGTVTVRAIVSTTSDGPDNQVITIVELDPTILAEDVERVCFAHLMRFNTDAFDEVWITDEVMEPQAALDFIEIFDDDPVGVDDIHILPEDAPEDNMTKNTEVMYVNLVTFGYSNTFARYITFNRNWTDSDDTLFLALPNCEIDLKKQSGGAKDEPIEITLPPVLPFSLLLANQAVGLVTCVVEEMDMFDESTRKTLFSGTAETMKGNNNGRSDVVLVSINGWRAALQTGLGIPCNNNCAWNFGDKTCRKDIEALGVVCTVVSITDREMVISDASHAPPYFRVGNVSRNGLSIFIRDHTANDTLLFVDKPPDSWVGQSVLVTPGCNKSLADCRTKWNNEENFGGLGIAIPSYHPLFESQ